MHRRGGVRIRNLYIKDKGRQCSIDQFPAISHLILVCRQSV